MQPIVKTGIRVLRPQEFTELRSCLPKFDKIRLDGLMASGLRYIEAQRCQENTSWFDGDFINLPEGSILKLRTEFKERTVRLSDWGKRVFPLFLKPLAKLPSESWWCRTLKKAGEECGLGRIGLSAKTTRKTWESWMSTCYPQFMIQIAGSQGHNAETQRQHYVSSPFLPDQIEMMRPYVSGWTLGIEGLR